MTLYLCKSCNTPRPSGAVLAVWEGDACSLCGGTAAASYLVNAYRCADHATRAPRIGVGVVGMRAAALRAKCDQCSAPAVAYGVSP